MPYLNNQLDHVEFEGTPGIWRYGSKNMPDVPAVLLKPRDTWTRKSDYDQQAKYARIALYKRYEQYAECISPKS